MKVSELKNKNRNPRKISPEQIDKLKQSIEAFPAMMELRPIVYDPDTMEVIGGNQRLTAIKALGMTDIPDTWAIPADKLTADEKQRFVIQDNHQSGDWDFDILGEDFDLELLSDVGIGLPDMTDTEYEPKDTEKESQENPYQMTITYQNAKQMDEYSGQIEKLLAHISVDIKYNGGLL